jgi:hypothetical protein
MRVRITRKLAEAIDGVDLSHNRVGEVIELPDSKARLVIAEGWAILERRSKVLPFRKRAKYARRADDPGVSRAS